MLSCTVILHTVSVFKLPPVCGENDLSKTSWKAVNEVQVTVGHDVVIFIVLKGYGQKNLKLVHVI